MKRKTRARWSPPWSYGKQEYRAWSVSEYGQRTDSPNNVIETTFTLEQKLPDSWRIRNVLITDCFWCLHTRHESGIKRCQFCYESRMLWIRNPKWKLCIRILNPKRFVRVNSLLVNFIPNSLSIPYWLIDLYVLWCHGDRQVTNLFYGTADFKSILHPKVRISIQLSLLM